MVDRAQRALNNVHNQPREVVEWCGDELGRVDLSPLERARWLWALGRARSELDEVADAIESLRDAVGLAPTTELRAEIRISLAAVLMTAGDDVGAETELGQAETDLTARPGRGRLVMQRGFMEIHRGNPVDAARLLDEAAVLIGADDDHTLARLLVNRAVVAIMLGRPDQAEDDCRTAVTLADRLRQPMIAAGAAHNLGYLAGQAGRIPEALRWFDEARDAYRLVGSPRRLMVALETDHASVLFLAGLLVDAAAAARRAARAAIDTGNRLAEAEARLLAARINLTNGASATAAAEAEAARALFDLSNRAGWAAMADHVAVRAVTRQLDLDLSVPVTTGTGPEAPSSADGIDLAGLDGLAHRAATTAKAMVAAGWHREALDAQLHAGRLWRRLGRADLAREHYDAVAEAPGGASLLVQATRAFAAALRAELDGDEAAALDAADRGMRAIEEHRARLGSTELRASASAGGADLMDLGLRLALRARDPEVLFAWADRWHAGSFVHADRPTGNPDLTAALAALRQAHTDAFTIVDETSPASFDTEVARREEAVRRLARRRSGSGLPVTTVELEQVITELRRDGAQLVEFVEIDGRLHRLVVDDDGVHHQRLGPTTEVMSVAMQLRSAVTRTAYAWAEGNNTAYARAEGNNTTYARAVGDNTADARAGGREQARETVREPRPGSDGRATRAGTVSRPDHAAAVAAGAIRLDDLLFGDRAWPDGPLVIVPTGALQGLPWGVLRGSARRATTISPSAWLWSGRPANAAASGTGAAPLPRSGPGDRGAASPPLLVAGPGLDAADDEVDVLARLHRGAVVLQGPDATVAAVVDAMGGADLAHLVAHGILRSDNPMLSSLQLADGPMTVLDIETIGRAPRVVVLSACDAGRSSVHAGDELIGTASALLQVGVGSVIAPVTVIPDRAVVEAMLTVHQGLRDGYGPAEALLAARTAAVGSGAVDAGSWATGAGPASLFVAVGRRG
ncbi:MAG: CHAT domain-containing protein [Acidimicrobiales bacterium]